MFLNEPKASYTSRYSKFKIPKKRSFEPIQNYNREKLIQTLADMFLNEPKASYTSRYSKFRKSEALSQFKITNG